MTTWTLPWRRRATPTPDTSQNRAVERADLDAAYRKGRRDEAGRHHGSPFLAFIGLIAFAAVVLVVYLAAQTGSFAGGGAVIDRNLASASERVQSPVWNAESRTGNALESAGQRLKQNAGDQTASR